MSKVHELRPPHYVTKKDGTLLLDKETGAPVWCGSAASRIEQYKSQAAPELTKELERVKARLAYFENKYGFMETQEWQEAIKKDNELYTNRVSGKAVP
ncbi:MAG: hypothetical protein WBY94_19950 [Polyangiaceae bacterium]|jgi:hypothetical protein